MAKIGTRNGPGKISESMALTEVKGENNNSRDTMKSTSPSKNGLEKINDPEIVNGNDKKMSDDSVMTVTSSESKKNARETKIQRKLRKSIEYSDDPEVQRIIDFLRNKNISESLISRILNNGLCDGFDRLLQALGITNEEMEKFSWQKRIDYPVTQSLESKPIWMFSDESMSPDNLYLKKHFGDNLVQAMKEIVKRKPSDPVDFLGRWLINRRVCEEREIRRKEFEDELSALRKLTDDREVDQQSEIFDYDEREESLENDWNFEEYEEPKMP